MRPLLKKGRIGSFAGGMQWKGKSFCLPYPVNLLGPLL